LSVVLFEFETWSLILRDKYGLKMFDNRMLRRIFGPKRNKITGDWRQVHNEELHNLYSSPNIRAIRVIKSRRIRRAGHAALIRAKLNSHTVLVGRPERMNH
jgi:hypothetical protein